MEHFTHFFLGLIDHAGYPGLFVVMVLANVGIPVGAEIVVPAAGALAGAGHLSSVPLTAAVATAGELLGNAILYAIGYAGGRPFVVRYGKYLKLDEKKLDAFHAFYERYGNVTVFVCRFLPFVRGIGGLPAGVSRMQKRWFALYTAAGSALFCFGLTYAGAAAGHHLDAVLAVVHKAGVAIAAVVLLVVLACVVAGVVRVRRKPA